MMRKAWITFAQGSKETNVVNSMTRIWYATVPKNQAWELDPSRPFCMYILTKETELTPDAETDGTVTLSHDILVPTVASGNAAPIGRYEVLVGTVSEEKVRLTITDRGANTLKFSGTIDTGTKVDAYYIPNVACIVQMRIEDPRRAVTLDYALLKEDAGILMAANPFHRNTRYAISGPVMIPEDYILSIWIKAPFEVAWVDSSGATLPAFLQLPVIVHDEMSLPEGYKEQVNAILSSGD